MTISVWSITPSDNATADTASGIALQEGMAPAQLNDSIRAIMAEIKKGWLAANLDDVPTAWTSTAIGASSATGTLGSATGTYRYKKLGRTVFYQLDMSIAAAGTGAGTLNITLPHTVAAITILHGRETGLSGVAVQGVASSTTLSISKYDNTTPIATGARVVMSGVYEATT